MNRRDAALAPFSDRAKCPGKRQDRIEANRESMATVGIKRENELTEDGALKRTSERASQRTWGTVTQDNTKKKHSFSVLYLNQAIFYFSLACKINFICAFISLHAQMGEWT